MSGAATEAVEELDRSLDSDPIGALWASASRWQRLVAVVVPALFAVGADFLLTGSWRSAYFWFPGFYLIIPAFILHFVMLGALVTSWQPSRERYKQGPVAKNPSKQRPAFVAKLDSVLSTALLIALAYGAFSSLAWAVSQHEHKGLLQRNRVLRVVTSAEELHYRTEGRYVPFSQLGVKLSGDARYELKLSVAGKGSVYVLQWGQGGDQPLLLTHTHGEQQPQFHLGSPWNPTLPFKALARLAKKA